MTGTPATAVIVVAVALAVVTALAVRAAVDTTRFHAARRRALTVVDGRAAAGSGEERADVRSAGWAGFLPEAPARLVAALDRAGADLLPDVAWSAWLAAMVVGTALVLMVGGLAVAVLAAAMGAAAPAIALHVRRHRGDERLEQGLPLALEAVARSVRSGASLRQSIGEAGLASPGRLGREFSEVARQAVHGATLVEALEGLAERHPVAGVRLAVAALCLGVETGGAQAKAIDGVATTLRDRFAVAAEVKALSSQARISSLVIGLAPLAFGAFAVTTDRRTGEFLFHTPLGIALVAVGVTLDGLGWLWMQHLSRVPV